AAMSGWTAPIRPGRALWCVSRRSVSCRPNSRGRCTDRVRRQSTMPAHPLRDIIVTLSGGRQRKHCVYQGVRRRWLAVWLCLCALGWSGAALAAPLPLVLDQATSKMTLRGHLAVYFDQDAHLQLPDLLAPDTSPAFTPLPGGLFGGFARRGAYWLQSHLVVPQDSGGEWWLVINAPWVEYMDAWITPADSAEVLWSRHSGLQRPVSSRDLDISLIALRAELPPGEYRLWMRAAGGRAISVQAGFWQLEALAESRARVEGLLLSLLGMMLLMVFIGLLLGWR